MLNAQSLLSKSRILAYPISTDSKKQSCLLQFVIALTSNNFSFLCGLYEGDPVEQAIRKWKCG